MSSFSFGSQMRVVIVVTFSILAFCSGRPQNGCPGDVDCDDPTTTPPPETTTYDHDGDDMGDGMEHTHGASAKAKGLVRQGDIRRPFPIPVAAPRPPPGPFPGPVPR